MADRGFFRGDMCTEPYYRTLLDLMKTNGKIIRTVTTVVPIRTSTDPYQLQAGHDHERTTSSKETEG